MEVLNRLIDVRSTDPEDARRRKLLNLLLMGVAGITLVALLVTTLAVVFMPGAMDDAEGVTLIYGGSLAMLLSLVVIYLINRSGMGAVASSVFLVALTVIFAFSDSASQVAEGRSLFLFTIPIIMASVLLQPYASFILATLCSAVISTISMTLLDAVPTIPAILGFYIVALVSWMSARSLERALSDLHVINRELDQRVIDRTHDLAEALSRVQTESNKNQAILESIADGVIVFDQSGKAIVANPSIAMLIDRTQDEITGCDIEALMGNEVSPENREMLSGVVRGKGMGDYGTKFEWGSKTFSLSFATVQGSASESIGTVVVFRDFTREAELDRMKDAFMSMASHELRTPLNAILGYSDMLKEGVYGAMSAEQSSTLDRIIANTRRMLNLVNNLLDQAQMQAGKLTMHMSSFSVGSLVDELQSIMFILAEQKGLQLDCSIAEDVPPQVVSDPQRLQQVLVNLMGNAIKFTDQGSVSLNIKCPDQEHWALEVVDTGPGISEDAQTYIFEPFRQVDDSQARRHGGSGLGLSIVKQIVSLLNGQISLSSRVGQGSRFLVTLPLTGTEES
jgi:PAS domain S-box-containing protein